VDSGGGRFGVKFRQVLRMYHRCGPDASVKSRENACKTVIGERMKGGGMRWGASGADAVSHLRAVFCSADDQWAGFWSMN
jgi:hypothetical protein